MQLGRITTGERERRTGLRQRFINRRRGPSLWEAEGRLKTKSRAGASRLKTGRGVVTAPIFLLVSQVKLPKRLDLQRDAEQAADGLPGLIVAKWPAYRRHHQKVASSCCIPLLTYKRRSVMPFVIAANIPINEPVTKKTDLSFSTADSA